VINPWDNLDITAVNDHIIGKIFNGNFDAASNFLSGQIKWFYIETIFYPFNLLHLILDDKEFYFVSEILKKILSYFSFYILAKFFTKNKFNSFISAIVYASIVNLEYRMGFAIIMLPYLLYLLTSKQKFKTKHFLILFFIGLNSDLARDYLALVLLIPLSMIMRHSIKNINIIFNYFAIITTSITIAALPIILSIIDLKEIHRVNSNNYGLKNILSIFNVFNYINIFFLPKLFLFNFILFLSFFTKRKKIFFLSIFFIFIYFLSAYINPLIKNYILPFFDFIKGFDFSRIDRCLDLIICIILAYNLKYLNSLYIKKLICFFSILLVITINLHYPLFVAAKILIKTSLDDESKYVELKKIIREKNSFVDLKSFFLNKDNFKKELTFSKLKSTLTFDSYYRFETYKFIKSIVKEDRVMSIGLDPMIAVMNDLRVIDGYHTLYPLSYKLNFRKIIAKELEINEILKIYYETQGNRVYAFFNDKNNLLINFREAKKIGANYIISSFEIQNANLEIVCKKCNKDEKIFLYKVL